MHGWRADFLAWLVIVFFRKQNYEDPSAVFDECRRVDLISGFLLLPVDYQYRQQQQLFPAATVGAVPEQAANTQLTPYPISLSTLLIMLIKLHASFLL